MADLVRGVRARSAQEASAAARVQTWHVALRKGKLAEYIDPATFSHDAGEARRKAKPVAGRPVSRIMEVVVTLVREAKPC